MHLRPIHHHSTLSPQVPTIEELFHFILRPIERAPHCPWRCKGIATRHCHLVAITSISCTIMCILMPHLESTIAQHMAAATQHHPYTSSFLLRGISLQLADCLQNEGECDEQHVIR